MNRHSRLQTNSDNSTLQAPIRSKISAEDEQHQTPLNVAKTTEQLPLKIEQTSDINCCAHSTKSC